MAVDEGFIEDKNDRLDSVPSNFVESVKGLEKDITKEIETLVSQLETENGNILLTDKNLSIIDSINKRLKDVIFNQEYEKNLTSFIGEFKTQADLNNEYFQTAVDIDFEPTSMYNNLLKVSQRNAIQLLNEDAFSQALIAPLQASLNAAVTTGQPFTETLSQLRYIIQGDDTVDGRLISHVKRVSYDAFAISDRAYTNTIATDLGLEFYLYSGGKVADTRCFCFERKGKYFHKKEIQNWGDGIGVGDCGKDWQGKNANTDSATIFFYVGGYNCKHSLLPVSIKSVPQTAIQRAKEKGYYKP